MHSSDTQAVCRGCGKVLRGKPYGYGGQAYIIETGEEAKRNHYGGWVCSRDCDYKAAMELEGSMPGGVGYRGSMCMAYPHGALERKWSDAGK